MIQVLGQEAEGIQEDRKREKMYNVLYHIKKKARNKNVVWHNLYLASSETSSVQMSKQLQGLLSYRVF